LTLVGALVNQDPAYSRLKEHLIASTGLSFYADRDHELTEMIGQRLADLRLRDCSSYADLLAAGAGGEAEMDVLIGKLTIGETSFFRDSEEFSAIRDIVLPDILERNQGSKQLRIWSAGCATGAEPYSLAILLAHDLADRIAGWQIDIRATDLNRSFLARAAEGIFRPWALRSISDEVKRDCFSNEGGFWTIHPRYKKWISFQYLNLAESEFLPPSTAGSHFDLILCRNVMIYFKPEVSKRLVGQFYQVLNFGGWLVVGASEHSRERYGEFRAVSTAGTKLYQKMTTPQGQPEGAPEPQPPPPMAAAHPLPPLPAEPCAGSAPGPAGIELLRQLVDSGDWQGAGDCVQGLLTQDRLNPAAYFYQALIFESLGVPDAAERSLRKAIYLDRNFAMAHYQLGLALQRDGQTSAAARSFGNLLRILEGVADQTLVMAGAEVTAMGLKDLARMHLEKSKGAA
jgi:chemotaxis protein methyltransferase CheR